MDSSKKNETPPLGVCLWLLTGGRLVDRIQWIARNQFTGVSLLQSISDVEEKECEEAAEAIVESGLNLSFHANVHHRVDASGKLDSAFVERVVESVIWWHENTRGVASCCADAIRFPVGGSSFSPCLNRQYIGRLYEKLNPLGIPVGIENAFGSAYDFHSIEHFTTFRDSCKEIKMGMLFDAAHANIHIRSDNVPGEDEIGLYFSNIPFEPLEIHLSDNRGEMDEHKSLGYGNLDLKSLLRAAKKRDFKGQLTIEVCKDIASHQYASDIFNPDEMETMLRSRDAILDTWSKS